MKRLDRLLSLIGIRERTAQQGYCMCFYLWDCEDVSYGSGIPANELTPLTIAG